MYEPVRHRFTVGRESPFDKGVDDLSDEDCRPMKARRRDMELLHIPLEYSSVERCLQWLRDLPAECEDKPSLNA
jgi:hypothetical protein